MLEHWQRITTLTDNPRVIKSLKVRFVTLKCLACCYAVDFPVLFDVRPLNRLNCTDEACGTIFDPGAAKRYKWLVEEFTSAHGRCVGGQEAAIYIGSKCTYRGDGHDVPTADRLLF